MAFEKVTLFGVPIVQRRRVTYGKIDAAKSRELLILHGLVERQLQSGLKFQSANERTLVELKETGSKTRRPELLIDDYRVQQFYEERLPDDIIDGASLRRVVKAEGPQLTQRLTMTLEDLVPETDVGAAEEAFPNQIDIGGMELPLEYAFQPGDENDGVTVTVPAVALAQIPVSHFGWLVPGLLQPRVFALIRSLPKRIRRNLVPAADVAKVVADRLHFGEGDFCQAVAAQLSHIAEQPVAVSDFKLEKLDQHLHLNVRVVDEGGETVTVGRNLDELRKAVPAIDAQEDTHEVADWCRDGITEWDFDAIPPRIEMRRGGVNVPAFPTLSDDGESVVMRVATSQDGADRQLREALTRLAVITERRELRRQVQWLPDFEQMKLVVGRRMSAEQLQQALMELVARRAFVDGEPLARTRDAWDAKFADRMERMSLAAQDVAKVLPKLFVAYQEMSVRLEELGGNRWSAARTDIEQQIDHLMPADFLATTPWEWLKEFPRFFRAVVARIEKLPNLGEQDAANMAELQSFWQQFQEVSTQHDMSGIACPELTTFRWMIEEYRVSLYAQSLGTSVSVSPQRLEKQFRKVQPP